MSLPPVSDNEDAPVASGRLTTAEDLTLRDVEIEGRRGLDVRLSGGRIAMIGPRLPGRGVDLDGRGGALIAGLHDHHIHLFALAARARSLDVGPASRAGVTAFSEALRGAAAGLRPGEWLRAYGFDEAAAGLPDRRALDAIVPDHPLRIQDRTGALWLLNTLAVDRAAAADFPPDPPALLERDADGAPTGRIWRGDAWLRSRLRDGPPSLGGVSADLARWGVTGVTDASVTTDDEQVRAFASAIDRGELVQNLTLMSGGGLRGDPSRRIVVGPVKMVLDDRALPDFDAAREGVRRARSWGRPVAAHCVTAAELAFFLALLADDGPRRGDRVEHGGVITQPSAAAIAEMGLTVVTQPAFISAKGDRYLAEVDAADQPWLYPCGSLLGAGIKVAASSDAPYGPADPWTALVAATTRRTRGGFVIGPGERIAPTRALALYQGEAANPGGPPRRVAVGAAADLCLLHGSLAAALAEPDAARVRATFIGGACVHGPG